MRLKIALGKMLTTYAIAFSTFAQAADALAPASSVPSTQPASQASTPAGTETVSRNTTVTPVKIAIMRRIKNNYPVFSKLGETDATKSYHAPTGTILEVRSMTTDGKIMDVVVKKVGGSAPKDKDADIKDNAALRAESKPLVEVETEYLVPRMSPHDVVQDSLITGYMVVPFKYHFNDHNLTADNTTVGYYVGWEFDTPSFSTVALPTKTDLILSLGITPISVPAQAGAQTTANTNLLGLTAAFGFGFSVADQVKVLGVCGKDWAKGYNYNAKTWCMAGIGYSVN